MNYFLPNNPFKRITIESLRRTLLVLITFIFCLESGVSFGQSHMISGIVTGSTDNAPLPSVSIRIKGTTIGTSTDEGGRFMLSVSANAVLEISYIGFLPQEIAVGKQTNLSIILQSDTRSMEEVVVVGYGSIKRGDLTSATASVKPSDFRQSGARNAMDLLQGKVAGLQVTRGSGTNPNSSAAIQLRGATSISGSNAPLVVIDGIPGGNLDLLQQEDIESIDVLKDGSAAAIYGTQANGGVILVTTKKGKSGATLFDYATYFRKEFVQRKPDFMTAEEYRQKIAEGADNRLTPDNDEGASVNAFDELINEDNLSQYHTLAISGGGENNSFRASAYYRDLEGIAKENERREYGVRANFSGKGFDNRLTSSVNLTHNFNDANMLGGGGWEWAYTRNPTQSLKNADGTWYYEPTSTNEVAKLQEEHNRRQQQTSSADGKIGFELIKGLTASAFGSVQRNQWLDGYYASLASEPSIEDDALQVPGGLAGQETRLEIDYAFEPTIDYKTTINELHSITAVAGYSYRYSKWQRFKGENSGFVNDIFEENNLTAGTQLVAGKSLLESEKEDNKLIAFFGRLNYSYNGKYLFQGIYRREGSSRFGRNNKWGNFGSVSAGWNLASEDFMQNVGFVNDLKFRIGYGITGNQGIPNYRSLVTLGTGNPYINPDGVWRQTYGPNRNPNPNLRWERKHELNVGLDFGLFNGRLSGAIDYYNRITKDLLGDYTSQQPSFIRNLIFTNVGQISSRGLEVTLHAVTMQKSDFTWTTDFTGSTSSGRMDSFSNDVYKADSQPFGPIGGAGALGNAIRTFEGGKLGQFYGKRFAGFTDDGNWLFYNREGEAVPFDQINDSPTDLANTDLAVIGNAIPKFYASLTNSFSYKNIDFRIFLRGRFGYDILNTQALSYGNKVALPNNVLSTAFTKYGELNDTYMYSDYYLENGSHVKIDEISLGYTFKLNTTKIRNFRVYVTGQNLATITGYSGNDPDFINDSGIGTDENFPPGVDRRSPYPRTRSFLIGLNIGF